MAVGRKSLKDEIQIMKYYADIMPKYFTELNKFLDSEDKNDKKFALQILSASAAKLIPQTIDGGLTNFNFNSDVPASDDELAAVKQALLSAVPADGGGA